jgi:hypothetical protein
MQKLMHVAMAGAHPASMQDEGLMDAIVDISAVLCVASLAAGLSGGHRLHRAVHVLQDANALSAMLFVPSMSFIPQRYAMVGNDCVHLKSWACFGTAK